MYLIQNGLPVCLPTTTILAVILHQVLNLDRRMNEFKQGKKAS